VRGRSESPRVRRRVPPAPWRASRLSQLPLPHTDGASERVPSGDSRHGTYPGLAAAWLEPGRPSSPNPVPSPSPSPSAGPSPGTGPGTGPGTDANARSCRWGSRR
jgi:hypothetical protein